MDVPLGVRHVAYRHSFVLYHSKYPTREGKLPIIYITDVLKLEVKNYLRIFLQNSNKFCGTRRRNYTGGVQTSLDNIFTAVFGPKKPQPKIVTV